MDTLKNSEMSFTIFIVDDDYTSLIMIEKLLQREGYITFAANEGEVVLNEVINKKPDLVLLDVNLPGISGQEVCRRLKDNVLTQEIPVLFLSAETDLQCKIDCFDAGGQDYITKPFEPLEVLVRVRTHLRLRQAQKMYVKILSSKINDISKAQQVFLPTDPAQLPDSRCAVHFQPLGDAGGDLYDIIQVSDDLYDYITADVCGHTIGLALATAALKTLLVQNCTPVNSPADVLSIINKVIPSVLSEGQYISVSWVRVNRRTKKAYVYIAGQPPVLYIPARGDVQKIDKSGDIIGIFPDVKFEHADVDVKRGDRFVLYSDGFIEFSKNKSAGRSAGIEKLMDLCENHRSDSIHIIVQEMVSSIYREQVPDDDMVA
ncbi:MAG TPA: SpoIIE family protein phosphatase, partial [Chitinispirillaceae bacterium]|nr:SpoIIE family protein phosphatase [Chitinispirillaceae bacterium]